MTQFHDQLFGRSRAAFLGFGIALCGLAGPVLAAPDEGPGRSRAPVVPPPSIDLRGTDTPPAPTSPAPVSPTLDGSSFGTLTGAGQYRRCLDAAFTEPDDAYDIAQTWRDQGGGAPALHCAALALVELGHAAEGARRLEELAKDPGAGEVPLRVQILGQAGNAWLLAENPGRAIAAFTAGVRLGTEDPEAEVLTLTYDRARARALLGEWNPAVIDLDTVLDRRPRNLSALVLRARARRLLGDLDGARRDVDAALAVSGDDPASLIERGHQHVAAGERDAARQAWVQAAVGGEGTPLAKSAQALLEDLDLVVDDPVTPLSDRPGEQVAALAGSAAPVAADPRSGTALPVSSALASEPRRAVDILREQGVLAANGIGGPSEQDVAAPGFVPVPVQRPTTVKRGVPRTALEALGIRLTPSQP